MKAIRVFDNNAVSTVMPDGREAIVLGKGIGFRTRPGDWIDEKRVEKIYFVQNEMQTKFLKLLQDVEPSAVRAAEQILSMAEEAGVKISDKATISLIDHIGCAIERHKKNIVLPNLLLNETRLLYQKEYELGHRALGIIAACCGVTLPEDEAGYIALHLLSISVDRNEAYGFLKFMKVAMDIVRETYQIALPQDSLEAVRLSTHLKFLTQRIQKRAMWSDDEEDPMYLQLLARDPRHKVCLDRMADCIQGSTGHTINNQERFYILIHLTEILRHGK